MSLGVIVRRAERDENVVRKSFTPTEAVAIGRLVEERESHHTETEQITRGSVAC